jgi:hypothetical protein
LHVLSDPDPAVHVGRLNGLYRDVASALAPLVPHTHPILATFNFPSPSPAPLRSALLHLRAAATVLRSRCAPTRDAGLDSVILRLDEVSALQDPPHAIVDAARALLKVAEDMRRDLRTFELGRMSERDLWDAARHTASIRERTLVLDAWGGAEGVRAAWKAWLSSSSTTPTNSWRSKLMSAFAASTPVLCLLPSIVAHLPEDTPTLNLLPPPFFLLTPLLSHVQDLLQALTATAALRALIRLPPGGADGDALVARVWALLRAEADSGRVRPPETTLAHLGDELVSARRPAGPLTPAEEEQLRGAVRRTLAHDDPVFSLLHRRLLAALGERLEHAPARVEIPKHIQAGRVAGAREVDEKVQPEVERLSVKGFEGEGLAEGINEVLGRLRRVVGWVEAVWTEAVFDESWTIN